MHRAAVASLLILLLLPSALLFAGGGRESTDTGAGTDGGAGPGGAEAPDFTIDLYQGGSVLGADGRESMTMSEVIALGKPVVLNFWAGLCPPCRVEMPEFQQVSVEHAGDLIILGIDLGVFTGLGTDVEARALLDGLGITYPAGTTADPAVIQAYGVYGMPSTFFIRPDGTIHDRWIGYLTRERFGSLVDALLDAS